MSAGAYGVGLLVGPEVLVTAGLDASRLIVGGEIKTVGAFVSALGKRSRRCARRLSPSRFCRSKREGSHGTVYYY